ncbi:MAG: TolC family protein [Proteobacteria bacterium]|nr:TolC family protein [Pseudomonadota bacterium]
MKTIIFARIIALLLLTVLLAVPAMAEERLTLKEALGRALERNPLMTEAHLGVDAGVEGIAGSRGKHWPKLSLNLAYNRLQDPVPYIPAQSTVIPAHFSDDYASLGLLLSLPIYQGGQIVTTVRISKVRRDLQQISLTLTRNELIANTVNTYHKLLQLQQLRDASTAAVTALETQVKNAGQLFDVGRIARVDLLKVEVQLANERQRQLTVDEALATTGATLRYLMGDDPSSNGEPLLLADALAMSGDRSAAAAEELKPWSGRPEYQAAVLGVKEADLSRTLSFGKFLPTVNAVAGYTDQYGFTPWYRDASWYFGLQASIPLFERSLYADFRRDTILKEKSVARQQVVEQQLRLDLTTAAASLRESANRVTTARQAIEQAHESFRIEQEKYGAGAGTMSDLLLAQSADMTAEANLSQAIFDYTAAQVAWRKANGTLEEYLK